MKKIPLLLMCLACIAAQASDHGSDHESLSDGGDQGVQALEGSPHGSRSASRNSVADGQAGVAGQLLEAMGDQEQIGDQRSKKSTKTKDDNCEEVDGDFEDLQAASSYEDSGDEGNSTIAMSLQVGSVFSQQWIERLSRKAKDGLVSYLQQYVQPAPTKKVNQPALALAVTMNQLAADKEVDKLLGLIDSSKKPILVKSFQIIDSSGFSVADHVLMLPKKDREKLILEMYKRYRKVLVGGRSRLYTQIAKGDASEVTFLLTYGANLDEIHGDTTTAKELLERKIVQSVQDKDVLEIADIRAHELARAVLRGIEENFALRLLMGVQNQLEKSKGKK